MGAALLARLRRLRGDERGYTLIELVITMTLLGTVMTALTMLFTTGMHAQTNMTARWQAQTQLNTALSKLRREAHSACSLRAGYTTSSITLNMPATGNFTPPSTPCDSPTTVTWCTRASTHGYALYRVYNATSCGSSGGVLYANYLTTLNVFPGYTAESGTNNTLAYLSVDFPIRVATSPNVKAASYEIKDIIVFRNSALS